jgi:hypothetical protein
VSVLLEYRFLPLGGRSRGSLCDLPMFGELVVKEVCWLPSLMIT